MAPVKHPVQVLLQAQSTMVLLNELYHLKLAFFSHETISALAAWNPHLEKILLLLATPKGV